MKKVLFFSLNFVASWASAGGDHFPIGVTEFASDGVDFKMTAFVLSSERAWMDEECSHIDVSGTYDRTKWLSYNRPMSEIAHLQAISFLNQALESKVKIYFGYIGSGLKRVSPCSYKSKAIFIEGGNVYSVYESI